MSTNVVISAGSVTVAVPVTTNEDNFVEPDEYFRATLSLPFAQEAVAVGSPDVAFVTILDTACMFGTHTFIDFRMKSLKCTYTVM